MRNRVVAGYSVSQCYRNDVVDDDDDSDYVSVQMETNNVNHRPGVYTRRISNPILHPFLCTFVVVRE